jgi:hypothetical protein
VSDKQEPVNPTRTGNQRLQYDPIVKDLLRDPNSFIRKLLTNSVPVVEELDKESIHFQSRVADLVWRLANGYILHIEIQSVNDLLMPLRMAEYTTPIVRRYGPKVIQLVIYVGAATLTMPTRLEVASHVFEYRLLDIRTLNAKDLLESGNLADSLLSLLTANGNEAVGEVIHRIAKLDPAQRHRALVMMHHLTGLRPNLVHTINEEFDAMPATYDDFDIERYEKDLDANWFFSRIRAQAARRAVDEAERKFLTRQLVEKYGPLPTWATDRIALATEPELASWSLRLISAPTLDAVFNA